MILAALLRQRELKGSSKEARFFSLFVFWAEFMILQRAYLFASELLAYHTLLMKLLEKHGSSSPHNSGIRVSDMLF